VDNSLAFLAFLVFVFLMKILMQKFQIGFFGIFDKLSSLCSQNFLFFKRLARKILICLEFLQNNLSSVI